MTLKLNGHDRFVEGSYFNFIKNQHYSTNKKKEMSEPCWNLCLDDGNGGLIIQDAETDFIHFLPRPNHVSSGTITFSRIDHDEMNLLSIKQYPWVYQKDTTSEELEKSKP